MQHGHTEVGLFMSRDVVKRRKQKCVDLRETKIDVCAEFGFF